MTTVERYRRFMNFETVDHPPMIDGGGYLISCDHTVPHNVPFENFAYLVELMKVHFGVK